MKIQLPDKILWKKITKKATDLYIGKQITKKLYRLILEADISDKSYIQFLKDLTEDMMRIRGYYNRQSRIEACDSLIDIAIENFRKEG